MESDMVLLSCVVRRIVQRLVRAHLYRSVSQPPLKAPRILSCAVGLSFFQLTAAPTHSAPSGTPRGVPALSPCVSAPVRIAH